MNNLKKELDLIKQEAADFKNQVNQLQIQLAQKANCNPNENQNQNQTPNPNVEVGQSPIETEQKETNDLQFKCLPIPAVVRQCQRVDIRCELPVGKTPPFSPNSENFRKYLTFLVRNGNFSRALSAFHGKAKVDVHEQHYLSTYFFPDQESGAYDITITTPSHHVVASYRIQTKGFQCSWQDQVSYCSPFFHKKEIPLPNQYYLYDRVREYSYITEHAMIEVVAGVNNQLEIRPTEEAFRDFPIAVKETSFWGIIHNGQRIHSFEVNQDRFDPDKKSYGITFDVREPGTYLMKVIVHWFFGKRDIFDPIQPILIGSHQSFQYTECDETKSLIFNGTFLLKVLPNPHNHSLVTPIDQLGRCRSMDHPGRWVMVPNTNLCQKPWCTGDREAGFLTVTWTGAAKPWVWVPYDCYYHVFNAHDLMKCTAKKGWKWIHIAGDSQVREVASNILLYFQRGDFFKFHHLDTLLELEGFEPVRLTFEAHHDIVFRSLSPTDGRPLDIDLLDHFNLGRFNHSKPYQNNFEGLNKVETTRPDVLIFNPALAYAPWRLPFQTHQKWLEEFFNYIGDAYSPNANPRNLGVWFSPPFLFSQAHEGSTPLTNERAIQFDEAGKSYAREKGWLISVLREPSRGRPDEAWDGLHYSRGSNEDWRGAASSMFTHMLLNMLFDDCDLD
jgi:hypothetical protein